MVRQSEERIFVALYNLSEVAVVNDSTNRVVATVPVGTHPVALSYDPNASEIFVANEGSANVSVISDANDRVVGTAHVGSYPGTNRGPRWARTKSSLPTRAPRTRAS